MTYLPRPGEVVRIIDHPYKQPHSGSALGCIGEVAKVLETRYRIVPGTGNYEDGGVWLRDTFYPKVYFTSEIGATSTSDHWLCHVEPLSVDEEAAWRLTGK